MGWNLFKKVPIKKETPIKRRPFVLNTDKIEDVIEIYAEASDLVFKSATSRKK